MAVTDETLELARNLRVNIMSTVNEDTRRMARAWGRAWNEIEGEMADAIQASAQTLVDEGRLTPSAIDRNRRLRGALETAADRIDRLAAAQGVQVAGDLDAIVAETASRQRHIVASQLPGTTAEVAATFDRASPEQLDAIVTRTTQQIESRAATLAPAAQEAMRSELVRSIAAGDNPNVAARQMLDRVSGAFDGGLVRATRIARTEMLDAHRTAGLVTDQANRDVVTGWRWQADLGGRVCPACMGMHGERFPPGTPGPDDHVNGRCTRLTITKTWRELGINQREPADRFPSADRWIAENPDQAREVLGPSRFEALMEGRISRRDLATTRRSSEWRDSQVATPVRDLLPG